MWLWLYKVPRAALVLQRRSNALPYMIVSITSVGGEITRWSRAEAPRWPALQRLLPLLPSHSRPVSLSGGVTRGCTHYSSVQVTAEVKRDKRWDSAAGTGPESHFNSLLVILQSTGGCSGMNNVLFMSSSGGGPAGLRRTGGYRFKRWTLQDVNKRLKLGCSWFHTCCQGYSQLCRGTSQLIKAVEVCSQRAVAKSDNFILVGPVVVSRFAQKHNRCNKHKLSVA